MENIIIYKEELITDVTSALSEMTLQRNLKAKTYNYVAVLDNYISAHNIERVFKKNVADFEKEQNGWSYLISTGFLNSLKIGEILEVMINEKNSNRYSLKSITYLVVVKNNEDSIEFFTTKTPFKSFKESLKLKKSISNDK